VDHILDNWTASVESYDCPFGSTAGVIDHALRRAQLCSTDPFCAEHEPEDRDGSLHGAACHSCVFLPETSCQSANRYLDRAAVVPTLSCDDLGFFPWTT